MVQSRSIPGPMQTSGVDVGEQHNGGCSPLATLLPTICDCRMPQVLNDRGCPRLGCKMLQVPCLNLQQTREPNATWTWYQRLRLHMDRPAVPIRFLVTRNTPTRGTHTGAPSNTMGATQQIGISIPYNSNLPGCQSHVHSQHGQNNPDMSFP